MDSRAIERPSSPVNRQRSPEPCASASNCVSTTPTRLRATSSTIEDCHEKFRRAEESRRAEDQRRGDESRRAEDQRRAEDGRRAEEARRAEEQRKNEETRKK